jgi:hypothetical protein
VPHITSYDSTQTTVLGYYQLGESEYLVNFISTEFGQGKFLIHTTPKILFTLRAQSLVYHKAKNSQLLPMGRWTFIVNDR